MELKYECMTIMTINALQFKRTRSRIPSLDSDVEGFHSFGNENSPPIACLQTSALITTWCEAKDESKHSALPMTSRWPKSDPNRSAFNKIHHRRSREKAKNQPGRISAFPRSKELRYLLTGGRPESCHLERCSWNSSMILYGSCKTWQKMRERILALDARMIIWYARRLYPGTADTNRSLRYAY